MQQRIVQRPTSDINQKLTLPLAAGSIVSALIASASAQYFNPYANRVQTYYDAGLTTNSNIAWRADPECDLILIVFGGQSWSEAKSYCEAAGGPGSRIAYSDEVCAYGYNSPAAFGQEWGDKWVAINDEPNGWIQIGDWP